jgi:hypothetical protein
LEHFYFGVLWRHQSPLKLARLLGDAIELEQRALAMRSRAVTGAAEEDAEEHLATAQLVLTRFLMQGLERRRPWDPGCRLRDWGPIPQDIDRGAFLVAHGARVWDAFGDLHPGADPILNPGRVFVCIGDERGPGCSLIFVSRAGAPGRCGYCQAKARPLVFNGRPTDIQPDGRTPFWADPWDPASRAQFPRSCVDCASWFWSLSRAEAQRCPTCRGPGDETQRRARASAARQRRFRDRHRAT